MEGWKNIEIDKIVLKTKLKAPTKEVYKSSFYYWYQTVKLLR
jgi:hypothetical protein